MHIMIFRKSIGLLPIIALIVIIIIRNTNNYCCLLLSSRANRCAHCSSCFDPYWTSGYCCLYLQVIVHESLYRPTVKLHERSASNAICFLLELLVELRSCSTIRDALLYRLSAHCSLVFYPLRQMQFRPIIMGLMSI